jgi:hypothetical protein
MTLVIYASYFGSSNPAEVFVYNGSLPLDYVLASLPAMDNVYSWRVF